MFDAFTRTFSFGGCTRLCSPLWLDVSVWEMRYSRRVLTSFRALLVVGCSGFVSSGVFRLDVDGCGWVGIMVSSPPPER